MDRDLNPVRLPVPPSEQYLTQPQSAVSRYKLRSDRSDVTRDSLARWLGGASGYSSAIEKAA